MATRRPSPDEPRIVAILSAVALSSTLTTLLMYGVDEAGLRAAVRTSARVSAMLFVLPFTASSLWALWRRPIFRSMLRYRRQLGLGFAVAQFVHAATFLSLAFAYTDSFFATTALSSIIGGSVGYALLTAMTLTSFDAPAAWLGRRAWRILHKVGSYALWAIFLSSYAGQAARGPVIWFLLTILTSAYALRLGAWVYIRRARAARTARTASLANIRERRSEATHMADVAGGSPRVRGLAQR